MTPGVLLAGLIGLASSPSIDFSDGIQESLPDRVWSDRYDRHFRKYGKRYFGVGFDWRWFKAQAIVESGLDPAAESPRGASGIMQITAITREEIRKHNPAFTDFETPRWNIAAGIWYDRFLYDRWRHLALDPQEQLNLTLASYNAGYVGILRAYDAAKQRRPVSRWIQVAPHSNAQTRNYLRKIHWLKYSHESPLWTPSARDQARLSP